MAVSHLWETGTRPITRERPLQAGQREEETVKLRTIWTMPACTLREKLHRTREWAWIWVAHHLPAQLRYHVVIDAGARNIHRDEVVPEVPFVDVLRRMDNGR